MYTDSINFNPTSYLPCSSSFVQSLHIPLLTHIQWSIDKHFKERQASSLVDLPSIEPILKISKFLIRTRVKEEIQRKALHPITKSRTVSSVSR